ncbi:MAG TPA: class I SAM-dependent methyltransferase [Acidimicrobiales bacterium]|jgi:SAM-dependent methyltransferase
MTFGPSSYGDAFAEVYDDLYGDVSDVAGTVATLAALAGPGPVLELGVGTGRVAIPLAAAGCEVHGVDASRAMVDRLRAKPGGHAVVVAVGDMADVATVAPAGADAYAAVLVAFNTFFSLPAEGDQRRCLAGVAEVLRPGGALVVEAYVPADAPPVGTAVAVRSIEPGRLVLTASITEDDGRTASVAHVDLRDGEVPRVRSWPMRMVSPGELDAMAATAGLVLDRRDAGWRGQPFGPASREHVSVYRRPAGRTRP